MRGAERLDASQVAAVENLVAAAVPGLNPSRVVIVDNHGQLLSQLNQGGDAVLSGRLLEQRLAIERRLKYRIQSLLEPSLGIGNVRAEVSVALNRSSVTVNQELFDPNSQVARSTQTTTHVRSTTDAAPTSVTVANNLPTSTSQNNASHRVSTDKERTNTTNYEISKTVRSDVTEPGAISRLSVAVLVNDIKTMGPNGKVTYKPRSAAELKQISNLVESAIGYNAKRGDQVQVVSMRFANNTSGISAPPPAFQIFGLGKGDLVRLAETLIISVVGLLVLLLVVRPMVLRTLSLAPAMAGTAPAGMPQLPPSLIPPTLAAPPGGLEQLLPQPTSEEPRTDAMIDIARVEGQVRASSVKKIGEIVERHPEQAVTIVRTWLSQGSEGR
jgi:flagellar M-ring protein FliF